MLPVGFKHLVAKFTTADQRLLLDSIREIFALAPPYRPTMPRTGKPLSVMMTNAGSLGWVTDKERGYRYQATHPVTGQPWPPIPDVLTQLWADVADYTAQPEACLINVYRAGTRMGSHVDADEEEALAPVVSVSLGDDAVFHVGGLKRRDPKTRMVLRSGDVVILGGAARRAYHGVDRIVTGTSDLIPGGGRINLTLRRVMRP